MNLHALLLFLSLPLLSFQLYGQDQLVWKELKEINGLPSNYSHDVQDDDLGMIWVATHQGLAKFDGYRVTSFADDSLTSPIFSIEKFDNGLFWLTSDRGLKIFDPLKESFLDHNLDSLGSIRRIIKAGPKTCLITALDGIYEIETDQDFLPTKVTFHRLDHFGKNPVPIALFIDDDDMLYLFIDRKGLFCGKREDLGKWNLFERIPSPNNSSDNASGRCLAIRKKSDDELFINYGNTGIFTYTPSTRKFTPIHYVDPIRSHKEDCLVSASLISPDKEHLFIFSTKHGLFDISLDDSSDKRRFSFSSIPNYSPINNAVNNIHITDNTIWMTTSGDGLKYAKLPKETPINLIPFPESFEQYIHITSIKPDKRGNLWMSTIGQGLIMLKPTQEGYYQLVDINEKKQINLLDDNVNALYFDHKDRLWLGTDDGLGLLSDEQLVTLSQGGRIQMKLYQADSTDQYSLSSNYIKDVFQDGDNLYVLTRNGINIYEESGRHFLNKENTENPLFNIETQPFYADKLGDKTIFNGKNISYLYTKNRLYDNSSWFDNTPFSILDIVQEEKEVYWLAGDIGLYKYHTVKNALIPFPGQGYFQEIRIHAMEMDKEGHLWAGTNQGLVLYDIKEETISKYEVPGTKGDLLFDYGTAYRNEHHIFLATNRGICVIKPNNTENHSDGDHSSCHPVITSLSPNSERALLSPTMSKENPELMEYKPLKVEESQVIHLELGFPAHHFKEKISIEYRIEGSGGKWFKTDSFDPKILLYKLPPGDYRLFIRTMDSKIKVLSRAMLPITVLAPWWKTKTAKALYLLSFLLIAAASVFYRTSQLKRKQRNQIKMMERQKQLELSALKLDLVSSISHEFSVPLTLLLNDVNTLGRQKDQNHDNDLQLDKIKKNGIRLKHLAYELSDIGKLEKKEFRLMVAKHDILSFVKDVTSLFDEFSREHGISLTFTPTEGAIPTWFNHNQLEKVICNLISNALKFTKSGDFIRVSVETEETNRKPYKKEEGPSVNIIVEDSGCGIPETDLDKIYHHGFSTQPSDNSPFESTGIGLYATKKIVELHHGTIEVSSKLEKGSIFTVKLPLGNAHFEKDQILTLPEASPCCGVEAHPWFYHRKKEEPDLPKPASPKKKHKILIAEDSMEMQGLLKSLLDDKYKTAYAKNGLEGLEMAKSMTPDLIITDLAMPRKNGLFLIRGMKSHCLTKHTPIIAFTAFSSDDKRVQLLNEGIDNFIAKPFDSKVLIATIENILTSRKELKETYADNEPFISEGLARHNQSDLLKRAITVLESNLSEPDFGVQELADKLKVSRSYLYQKFAEITEYSPKRFIHIMRVRKGAKLLRSEKYTLDEISSVVGYNTLKNFRKYFKDYYGISPSRYTKSKD